MTDVEGDIALKFDVASVRSDFPILGTTVRGVPLCYLDNGATTQKPLCVIETIDSYYKSSNSNIHRGVHHLSQVATELYENARATVRRFINAASDKEIIFTRSTTESINLVASSFGNRFISQGDEILITEMEHHSNIVPWQLLCERTGAILKVANVHPDGTVDIEDFKRLLSTKTKIVSVVHVSNSLGTINPIKDIIEAAHQVGAKVLIDGAQAVAHIEVDVQGLDCDFYVFSGHKLYAPTGIGVLYGKEEILNAMPPYQGGGDMILSVSFDKTVYNELPAKFEAGTPHIAGAIGLATAIDYLLG
ncbi:MAG: aminotransferase class V-fold PLP-dependent enzyme, partial [Candidatus Kapabacteria bacterium]|nr:aminotransferase class V-fold PLP-dependent enzyme [Candidatus Kapabacteria bacterium]